MAALVSGEYSGDRHIFHLVVTPRVQAKRREAARSRAKFVDTPAARRFYVYVCDRKRESSIKAGRFETGGLRLRLSERRSWKCLIK